jgi:ABC-type multidrug transport system fused ATPase/permease subunit
MKEELVPMEKPEETPGQRRKKAMRRLIQLAKPEYPYIFVSLCGLVANSATTLSFPYLLGRAVDHFSTREKPDDRFLYVAGGVFAVGSAASWVRVYYMGVATERIAGRLRKMLFDRWRPVTIDLWTRD